MARNRYREIGLLEPESAQDRLRLAISFVNSPPLENKRHEKRLGPLRKRLAGMLKEFVGTGRVSLSLPARELPSGLRLVLRRSAVGSPVASWGGGSLSANWALSLAFALASPDAARLRHCPGCGRCFLRFGKAEHCSQRCTRRLYMRRYREEGR